MNQKHIFTIQNLHVSIDKNKILSNISITIQSKEVHVIMGPNGSGKSTLAYALMGFPDYKTQQLKKKSGIFINNKDITHFSPEERAKEGLFLAYQSPVSIPGVSVFNLLRTAYQSIYPSEDSGIKSPHNPALRRSWNASGMTLSEFVSEIKKYARILGIPESLLQRGIHDGFSGGEKKKIEMLEALILKPKFGLFDEIDTGLDVDALQSVSQGIDSLVRQGTGVLIITHYQRILRYIKPTHVHVLVGGEIVESGDITLVQKIEKEGYKRYTS
ncbi:Fe-S cluster assembly ATPase SufC [Patescibacteria group bacterium]